MRNICAHHARLYNRAFTLTFKLPQRPHGLASSMNAQAPRRLYNTLVVMQHLLDRASPGHTWTVRLMELMHQHADVSISEVGFPGDWRLRTVWRDSGVVS